MSDPLWWMSSIAGGATNENKLEQKDMGHELQIDGMNKGHDVYYMLLEI